MIDFIHYPPQPQNGFQYKDCEITVSDCYHFFSKGLETDTFFRNDKMKRRACNCFAIACLKNPKVVVLGFNVMSNHFHTTLHATLNECQRLISTYVRLLVSSFSQTGDGNLLESIIIKYEVIDTLEYLLTCLAYGDINPLKAGVRHISTDYRWGSSQLMFRAPGILPPENAIKVETIPKRNRKSLFNTHCEIPDDWLFLPDGLLWPGNFTDFKMTEELFSNSPFRYYYFLSKKRDNRIISAIGNARSISITDTELRRRAGQLCQELFQKEFISELSLAQRLQLARHLNRQFGASFKQLGRIVHIKGPDLEELLK